MHFNGVYNADSAIDSLGNQKAPFKNADQSEMPIRLLESNDLQGNQNNLTKEPLETVVDGEVFMNSPKKEKPPPLMFYLKDRRTAINLFVMCYLWTAVCFNYYFLIYFVKYLSGDIFQNTFMMATAEITGVTLSLVFVKFTKLKLTFQVGFCISLTGGLLILVLGTSYSTWMPFFVILAKFGVSMNLNVLYLGSSKLFPVLFVGRAFGITNLFARLMTILAPMVTEMPDPIPIQVFCVSIFFAIVVV